MKRNIKSLIISILLYDIKFIELKRLEVIKRVKGNILQYLWSEKLRKNIYKQLSNCHN